MIIGRQAGEPPAGLPETRTGAEYVLADSIDDVRASLAECDVVFHYGRPRDALSATWALTDRLCWVHVGGVGIDWALFDELVESDVVLTNSRGVFDVTLPEYLLTLMLALVKDLPGTVRAQAAHEWRHRLLQPLAGGRAVIIGAGSIARASGRMLRSLGLEVTLVGRSERDGEPGEGRVRAVDDLPELLPAADWLVLLAPLTQHTRGLIGAPELALLPQGARVVSLATHWWRRGRHSKCLHRRLHRQPRTLHGRRAAPERRRQAPRVRTHHGQGIGLVKVDSLGMSLVALDGLTKRYPGGVLALDDLTLTVEPGVIGLVGANGAGKSTLIKILLGLLDATSGSARVFDLDVANQGLAIRQLVGYLPEHDCLPSDISASDFVNHMARMSGLPRSSARERTAEVLRHVGLFEERYRPMGGYSTGMKQRVKLAQSLVHDPRLLLLDEPTNGLDPAGRDDMLDLIERTGNEFGIAIIMASHLLGEIERVCEYLVAIDAGHLLRAAELDTFTQRTGTLLVEVDERPAALAERLSGSGYEVRVDGMNVLVEIHGDETYDRVRDAAVDLELALIRIEPRRASLEDLFRDATPTDTEEAA